MGNKHRHLTQHKRRLVLLELRAALGDELFADFITERIVENGRVNVAVLGQLAEVWHCRQLDTARRALRALRFGSDDR